MLTENMMELRFPWNLKKDEGNNRVLPSLNFKVSFFMEYSYLGISLDVEKRGDLLIWCVG
jgi:hypothetical protein